jgi:vitamin B12/bleomycin/antimicrobial peptide transport system ATP-binding/permease protein
MSLKFTALKQEADLRFALVRVRENSESISFYNGQAAEAACVSTRFTAVVETIKRVINLSALLDAWRNCYDYATILVPPVIIAPRYFRGEIQFGVVTQVCPCYTIFSVCLLP